MQEYDANRDRNTRLFIFSELKWAEARNIKLSPKQLKAFCALEKQLGEVWGRKALISLRCVVQLGAQSSDYAEQWNQFVLLSPFTKFDLTREGVVTLTLPNLFLQMAATSFLAGCLILSSGWRAAKNWKMNFPCTLPLSTKWVQTLHISNKLLC